MRQIINWLTASLTVALLGGTLPANASAFLWISAPAWSYSAAAAASPAGTAAYWGLSIGAGSYSYAFAYSFLGGNAAAAYAVSRAGFGGAGAWYATGFADPQADISIGIPLLPLADLTTTADYPSDLAAVEALTISSPAYTVGANGLTFSSSSESELNGLDEIAAFLYTGPTSQSGLCSDLGQSSSCTTATTSSGDVTNINTFYTDFGGASDLTMLGEITDPNNPTSLAFNTSLNTSQQADVILVAEATTVPEPASILVIAPGLLSLGLFGWLRRRKGA